MIRHSIAVFLFLTVAAWCQAPWHPAPPNPPKEKSGAVVGTVSGADNKPVQNATVLLKDNDTDEQRTATSDALGHYEFRGVFPGPYSLQAMKNGKEKVSEVKQIRVLSGSEEAVNLTLR